MPARHLSRDETSDTDSGTVTVRYRAGYPTRDGRSTVRAPIRHAILLMVGHLYRRDIEPFVARDEIERRIDKAADGAKMEAAKGLAEVAGQVRYPRTIGRGPASAAPLAFGWIVPAKIGLAGR